MNRSFDEAYFEFLGPDGGSRVEEEGMGNNVIPRWVGPEARRTHNFQVY